MPRPTRPNALGPAPAPAPAPARSRERASAHSPILPGSAVLAVVLGDQLDRESLILQHLRPGIDTVLMAEVLEESRHVPSHRQRTTLFLAAMRHHAEWLRTLGFAVRYITLDDPANTHSLAGELKRAIAALLPASLVMVEPGERRIADELVAAVGERPFKILEDSHFLTSHQQFEDWAAGRRDLTMEYFYRSQRKRLSILVDAANKPIGGDWNFDSDNRRPFPKSGPSPRPRPAKQFPPDAITLKVLSIVNRLLPAAPGRAESFAWPVTRPQALEALDDFIKHRLDLFGPYEDAMWQGEPTIYHSTLSAPLNLKLLNPKECIAAAIKAYEAGTARLQSVEAFIRQLIGWREYIRGIYYREGPDYSQRNYLGQHGALPEFYWSGQTDMACMRECIGQVVEHGFGHHIQRLMVMGNFALISGVHPRAVSDWYLAMYIDGVDWVTLPNALGMVMHADGTADKGPVVGTKPYCASGQYIKRMSNYCTDCKYNPAQRTGATACPFTTFYWDFLIRHRARFERNPRMALIIKHLDRMVQEELQQITITATSLRRKLGIGAIDRGSPPSRADYAAADYSPPPQG